MEKAPFEAIPLDEWLVGTQDRLDYLVELVAKIFNNSRGSLQ